MNVEMMEVQEVILNLSDNDMAVGIILNDVGWKGAWMKIAEMGLTYNGEVESFDTLTDSAERLRR